MGPWKYFAPLWLGAVGSAALYLLNLDRLPGWPAWVHVTAVAGGAPLLGVLLQLVTVGVQGAFAQVLPVPGGRSIRGRSAVVAGILLLGGLVFGAIGVYLGVEGLAKSSFVVGGVAGLSLLSAVAVYFWALPAAVRDFGGRD